MQRLTDELRREIESEIRDKLLAEFEYMMLDDRSMDQMRQMGAAVLHDRVMKGLELDMAVLPIGEEG
jgi:hypothetical protein